MGELLYFKNCEERKKAEELLKKYWPEASFVVMRLDMQNTIEEERVHFGKWDIEFKKKTKHESNPSYHIFLFFNFIIIFFLYDRILRLPVRCPIVHLLLSIRLVLPC